MSKKPNFLVMLENQIDKIVLGLMIIISLVLLWLYVLSNPYAVKVGSKKMGPGQIDRYAKEQADRILVEMDELAPPRAYNGAYLAGYEKNIQCPISDVANLAVPYPGIGDVVIVEDRLYAIPEIGELTDVQVASLRGAAKVPTQDVAPDNPYKNASSESGDIDQVTVSANFDIRALMTNFQLSFMGPQLKSTWKDSSLATPIFARLELQRRVKDPSGWSDWTVVPRTKIDMYKKRLEDLPLTADEASFGVGIYISQYQNNAVQLDILQPEPYQFTVSRADWMPPSYLHETYSLLEKEAGQRRRDELDARKKQETDRNRRRTNQPQQRQRPQRGGRQQQRGMDPMMMLGMETDARAAQMPTRKERTLEDVEKEAELTKIKEGTKIESLREAALVWAHDDTTEPGQTYQYRLRMGVFNPIAGKDWFQSHQEQYKDQFVLWSDYSLPTEEVYIPKMLHVFPMDVVERADAAEGVKVEVAKYFLGKWRTHDFEVYPGETIGYEVEDVAKTDEKQNRRDVMPGMDMLMMMDETGGGALREPEAVDFSTGMTMVDISRQINWGSRLRRGFLYQLIYYDPEMQMQQISVSKNNWGDRLRGDYNQVQDELDQDVKTRPGGGRMDGLMMMNRM